MGNFEDRRALLHRVGLARQQLVTAIESVKPATTYDLYDLQPSAMGIYNNTRLRRFSELDLVRMLATNSQQAVAEVAGLELRHLDWCMELHANLTRFFGRFRDPPYWFKEVVFRSLMLAYHHPDRFLEIPWEFRYAEPAPRPWFFLEPDGTQSDQDYVAEQLDRFRTELHAVLARVSHHERTPVSLNVEQAPTPDVVDEWAALWVAGDSLEAIKERRMREFGEQPDLPAKMMERLELVGWPTDAGQHR